MNEVKLDDLLAKYKQFTPPEIEIKRVVSLSVEEVCGFEVLEESISVVGDHVYISLSPLKKTRILIHKDTLIRKIKEGLSTINPPTLL